jgi:hypothetical protein
MLQPETPNPFSTVLPPLQPTLTVLSRLATVRDECREIERPTGAVYRETRIPNTGKLVDKGKREVKR